MIEQLNLRHACPCILAILAGPEIAEIGPAYGIDLLLKLARLDTHSHARNEEYDSHEETDQTRYEVLCLSIHEIPPKRGKGGNTSATKR